MAHPLRRGEETVTALLRYQYSLLLRSHRWVPPVALHAAFVIAGVQWKDPLLDSLGWAAAVLLPATAWLVRLCVTNEPEASRQCVAAAVGPFRTHLSSLLAAFLMACVMGAVGVTYSMIVCIPYSSRGHLEVSRLSAGVAGVLAALACALIGTAVGAVCNRPLLRSAGWAVPAGLFVTLLVLVLKGSPANAAVKDLITGSHTGEVTLPWSSTGLCFGVAVLASGLACGSVSRRG
jgi:hypothetical protein